MSEQAQVVDGRHLRRERGRRAVIDAVIDLVLEGETPPSAETVAARAGVSQASVFRYFDTLDELRHDAVDRYILRFADLLGIPDVGVGPAPERVRRLVAARDAFFERTAPMARLTRRQSVDVPELAETLDRLRSTFIDQIAQHFAPELERLEPRARKHRVAAIAALTSFEGWDQLAALGEDGRREALRHAVGDLLSIDGMEVT